MCVYVCVLHSGPLAAMSRRAVVLIIQLLVDTNREYCRTPEIEIADLSQSDGGLNLSQFQIHCLLRINSSTAILSYFELHKSIPGIVTTLTNENIGTQCYLRLL